MLCYNSYTDAYFVFVVDAGMSNISSFPVYKILTLIIAFVLLKTLYALSLFFRLVVSLTYDLVRTM